MRSPPLSYHIVAKDIVAFFRTRRFLGNQKGHCSPDACAFPRDYAARCETRPLGVLVVVPLEYQIGNLDSVHKVKTVAYLSRACTVQQPRSTSLAVLTNGVEIMFFEVIFLFI